jgi:chemotaxis protein CheD
MLLAVSESGGAASDMAGVNAMELLINDIIKHGGDRRNLKSKVFGGARMVSGLSDIGDRNGNFALNFLANENIECLSQSLGGDRARNIRFWPATGRVQMRLTGAPVEESKPKEVAGNDMELF